MKLRKRIAAMGAATVMAVSMVSLDASAYGTAKFSKKLAQSDDYNDITKTSNYSIEYCYGVWVTSIVKEPGYNEGTPRFKVETGSYSDWVDVYSTKQLYAFDSSMCRGKKTYTGSVKNTGYNAKCKVTGEFRFM